MKRCAQCGGPISTDNPRAIYCSSACRLRAYRGGRGPTYPTGLRVIRCPCCGASRERNHFVEAALGRVDLAAMTQRFTDEGIKWERSDLDNDQATVVGRAVATARDRMIAKLGGEPDPDPVGDVAAALADPDVPDELLAGIEGVLVANGTPLLAERLRAIADAIDAQSFRR